MPNSLTDLNTFSSIGFQYVDPGSYAITISNTTPGTQSVSTAEDDYFTPTQPTAITALSAVPDGYYISLTINASAIGTSFYSSWETTTFPAGMTLTKPSAGVYTLSGFASPGDWDTYSSFQLVAKDRATNWSYTSTISYPDPTNVTNQLSVAWTTNVAVNTTHNELSGGSSETYTEDTTKVIMNNPTITDEWAGPGTYTLTIVPSDTSAVLRVDATMGLGGTSSWNATTKTRTLTGTAAQINYALETAGALVLIPYPDSSASYNLVYTLTNPISGLVTSYSQAWTATGAHSEYSIGTAYNYSEDTTVTLSHSITDVDPNVTNYEYIWEQITPDRNANPGRFIVNSVAQDTNGYFAQAGSKTTLNNNSVVYDPPPDYTGTITLYYTQQKLDPDTEGYIVQASNVSITLTNTSSHNDYSLTTSYNTQKTQT